MPEGGIILNPGSGGNELDAWIDPVTGRRTQSMRLRDDRGGVLYRASSGLITLTAGANLQIFGFTNPAGSGRTAYVHHIFAVATNIAAAAAIAAILTRTSNVNTSGTALTAVRPDNGTVGNLVIPRVLPTTLTAVGGSISSIILPLIAGAAITQPLVAEDQVAARDIQVPAGTGLLLAASGTPNANHRASVDIVWEEV